MSKARVRQRAAGHVPTAGQIPQDTSPVSAARPPAFADVPLLQAAAASLRAYSDLAWNVYGGSYPELETLIGAIERRLGLPATSHRQERDQIAAGAWVRLHGPAADAQPAGPFDGDRR